MPFHLQSPERAKRVAKSLASELKQRGIAGFSHIRCLDLVARMYGHAGHEALVASCGQHPPSPDDDVAGPETASMRRDGHVLTLVSAGIPEATARQIVDAIEPTRRSDARSAPLFKAIDPETRRACLDARDEYIAMRRRRAGLMVHDSADDRHAELTGLDFTDLLLEAPAHLGLAAVEALTRLHDRGCDAVDMRSHFRIHVDALMERSASGLPAVSQADAGAMRTHVKHVSMSLTDAADTEEAEKDFAVVFDAAGLGRIVVDRLQAGTDLGRRFFSDVVDDLDAVVDARISLAQLAGWIAPTFDLVPGMAERSEYGTLVQTLLEEAPVPAFSMLPAPDCDAVLLKSFEIMLGKGVPRALGDGRYFMSETQDRWEKTFDHGDGRRVLTADALASAQHAGLGMADFIRSVVQAAKALVMLDKLADGVSWHRMLNGLALPEGRADRHLAAVGVAYGFVPRWNDGQEAFRLAIAELCALDAAGFRLTDICAVAWAEDMPVRTADERQLRAALADNGHEEAALSPR